MADDPRIQTIRDVIRTPTDSGRRRAKRALDSLAADLAAAEARATEAEREARAENERLRHRIDYLLRTDPSEWEPEVIRWLSPAALAAAQEPPAEGGDRRG